MAKDPQWVRWPVLLHSAQTAVAAQACCCWRGYSGFRKRLGAEDDLGDYAVLTGAALAVSWQRFVGTALGAVVGAIAASSFKPYSRVAFFFWG